MGSIITEVKHFKFLGLIFDSKLSWDKHIEEINTCLIRRGNILKSLTSKKTYLSTTLLLRVYKALIRSKLDYGAAALVNIPKSKIEILERTQNQLLRIILGCLKSTPKALLHLETNILPVHMRWQNLAANYFLKLSNKPFNPAYKIIKNLYESNATWPVRSIPASIPTLKFVDSLDATNLFSLQSSNKVTTHPIPPWKLIKIEGRFFPLSKTQARLQPTLAKKLFTEILATEQPNHILAYTDGSVLSNPESVACAVYIPKLKIEKAWKLTKFTNIFNAELAAILQTLKLLYSQDETVKIVILSDSKSSIQAIINHRWEASPLISEIIQLIYNYRYAGCNVVLQWIPSHCGCPGNETADKLASDRASSLTGDTWTNSLSNQEILNALKQKAQQELLTSSKTTSSNPNRNIKTALFRLRSGHNKLNHCVAKWDSNVSPNCPHGCPEYENAQHVILHCHHFFEARSQLSSLLSANNIQPELPSILGLNATIPKHIQEKIKSSLIAFIVNTELIRRI